MHVSITNWIKNPVEPVTQYTLNGTVVAGITPQLRPGFLEPDPAKLKANNNHSFIGCQPSGAGFFITSKQAAYLHTAGEGSVVKRLIGTEDITDQVDAQPHRWIIDFGTMPLEHAMRTPKALALVRFEVKDARETAEKVRRKGGDSRKSAELWWQFAWPRPGMRKAIAGKDRYIVCTLHGKRFFTAWAEVGWCPNNSAGAFPFDDDYYMGVLASSVHRAWAWGWSSTLETRLRYTPTTTFATFPWPDSSTEQRAAIAKAAMELMMLRSQISKDEKIGLTALYNRFDDGAYQQLRKLHIVLDQAVTAAYGWPKTVAANDVALVRRLRELNRAITEGRVAYNPFA